MFLNSDVIVMRVTKKLRNINSVCNIRNFTIYDTEYFDDNVASRFFTMYENSLMPL